MLALGLIPEHTRGDRDKYITLDLSRTNEQRRLPLMPVPNIATTHYDMPRAVKSYFNMFPLRPGNWTLITRYIFLYLSLCIKESKSRFLCVMGKGSCALCIKGNGSRSLWVKKSNSWYLWVQGRDPSHSSSREVDPDPSGSRKLIPYSSGLWEEILGPLRQGKWIQIPLGQGK